MMETLEQQLAGLSPEQRQLVERLLRKEQPESELRPAAQKAVTGPAPLLPSQRWFLDQAYDHLVNPNRWNFSMMFEAPPGVPSGHLEQSIGHIFEYHDALRARFDRDEQGWHQTIEPVGRAIPFTRIDLSGLSSAEQLAAVKQQASDAQSSLSIDQHRLTRFVLFDLGNQQPARLLVVIHHLLTDVVSTTIVLQDLALAYLQLSQGQTIRLPAKTASLKEWAERLERQAQSEELQRALEDYWRSIPWDELHPLPVDHAQGRERNTWGSLESVSLSLEIDETRTLLRLFPQRYRTPVATGLLFALVQTLTAWSGDRWACVSQVDSGRHILPPPDTLDLSRTAGWLAMSGELILQRIAVKTPAEALQSFAAQINQIPYRGFGQPIFSMSGKADATRKLGIFLKDEVVFDYWAQVGSAEKQRPGPFRVLEDANEIRHHPENQRFRLLDCRFDLSGDRLRVNWRYSRNVHQRATIEKLAVGCVEILRWLMG
ncbi:MAG TPA: condensation domain-containing protein [Anaerolineae bacterium]|nr:condensation domain-containing protein [Anaerolineae bacterium]